MSFKILRINQWDVDLETGELCDNSLLHANKVASERIDPLGIKLLVTLAERHGELVSKDILLSTLWPETVVNEDALTRCVSRLRKLLGDDPRQPEFIETLPKRGYRLVATSVEWLDTSDQIEPQSDQREPAFKSYFKPGLILVLGLIVITFYSVNKGPQQTLPANNVSELVRQADDYYHTVNRQNNEMALELYQQAVALAPDSAEANSGLANALVQRAIRMPTLKNDTEWENMSLSKALSDGRLFAQAAKAELEKAAEHSRKALALAPNNARPHKALGFVLSAQNQLDSALQSYQKALSIDPSAWDVLINMGEVSEISGQLTDAIVYYKKALNAMNNDQPGKNNRGRPWRADLGATIGDKYLEQNNVNEAEIWYRHVLTFAPFNHAATKGLSLVLSQTGRIGESKGLCQAYLERVGSSACGQSH